MHGAFTGLLGHDDARTQKEAAALPLLSPYKDLPVNHSQTAAGSKVAENAGNSDKAITDSKARVRRECRVRIAAERRTEQSCGRPRIWKCVDSDFWFRTRESSPQPLQQNGVEAHQLTGTPLNRPKFIYRPATSVVDNAGHKVIRPEVHVADDSVSSDSPTDVQLANFAAATEDTLPPGKHRAGNRLPD